jgi:PAS domain S-box-containing protein
MKKSLVNPDKYIDKSLTYEEIDALIESSYDGLYITDGNANTIKINRAYERITGLKREKLLGKNMRELVEKGIFDNSVTLEVLKKRRPVTIMQNVMGNKKVMVSGNPIFDRAGKIILVVTNVRDVTELVELREKLEESQRLRSLYYQALLQQEQYDRVLENMVVKSKVMNHVIQQAIKVSGVTTSVLLVGESGVGKTMLAKIIHNLSPRKKRPFVKINCGAIPENLIESELFGYEKGAFTGALDTGKAGMIEMAHTGTLFLDEIGEVKIDLQVKLLNFIDERSFKPVGGVSTKEADVRIIAATNIDLKKLVEVGRFREDLYYRLNVVPIFIPPLRERREDIPILVFKYLNKLNKRLGFKKRFSQEVLDCLTNYAYPGNVRELINIVERIVIMSEGDEVLISDLPSELTGNSTLNYEYLKNLDLKEAVGMFESELIKKTLKNHNTISSAARVLRVHPSTLIRKMRRYHII